MAGCSPKYAGGCDKELAVGTKIAHCAACHETFSVPAYFDAHRKAGRGEKPGQCVPPAELRFGPEHRRAGEVMLKQNRFGVWVGAEPNPRFAEGANE